MDARVEADIPEQPSDDREMKRSLSAFDLVMLGIGSIIGTGIFVLPAIGVAQAGPGLLLAFVIAGAVCGLVALAYAELASIVPVAGSAYSYGYATMGRFFAWMIGWNLVLQYGVTGSAVAIGWSGYFNGLMKNFGAGLPIALTSGYFVEPAGLINLPAFGVVLLMGYVLFRGTKGSAILNNILVMIKTTALLAFLILALPEIDPARFVDFIPRGFWKSEVIDPLTGASVAQGVMAAAMMMFFAYVGFDAVSTAGEEARHPARDLPIGILGALLCCAAIYVLVGAGVAGAVDPAAIIGSKQPLADVLITLGHPMVAAAISGAVVLTLPTVVMLIIYAQTRICFAQARDGLLPRSFAALHPTTGVPAGITLLIALLMASVAGTMPLEKIASMSNAATLTVYMTVVLSVMILRLRQPDLPRRFRCPGVWMVGPFAIIGCVLLLASSPRQILLNFLIWNIAGGLIYLFLKAPRNRSQTFQKDISS
jgi:APA family basic amino acid/polyamine antiporter